MMHGRILLANTFGPGFVSEISGILTRREASVKGLPGCLEPRTNIAPAHRVLSSLFRGHVANWPNA